VKLAALKTLSLAILVAASAAAQITTLTQSTNNTTVTVGASIACAVGNPVQYTVDNSYYRSYPLTGQPGNVDVVSIRFGVEQVSSTTGTRPMIIRLWNDPNGGVPAPTTGLVLRHTENFTLPVQTTPGIITQAITGPPVSFLPTETLVVEINSPTGGTTGNLFFIGSNALGQTAPGFLKAATCGITDATDLVTVGYPNMHMIIDVNIVPSGQTVPYPGTGEDYTLFSAINANPLTTGIGNSLKTAVAGDLLTLKMVSSGGTFDNKELVLVAEGFVTGFPPFPPAAANIHVSFAGLVLLLGGVPGPLGPPLLPSGGTTLSFTVPPGLTGGSVLFQSVVITYSAPLAANGLYASTDGHEIQIL
jgi:hypothetical protein